MQWVMWFTISRLAGTFYNFIWWKFLSAFLMLQDCFKISWDQQQDKVPGKARGVPTVITDNNISWWVCQINIAQNELSDGSNWVPGVLFYMHINYHWHLHAWVNAEVFSFYLLTLNNFTAHKSSEVNMISVSSA